MQKDITIIGSGLVGSLLGIYLAKKGYNIKIFEKRGDMRQQNVGAGRSINLALSDRGLNALQLAGISDEVMKYAIPMYGRQIHHLNGQTSFQPYGKNNQAIHSVSRAGLNILLMNLAEKQHNLKIKFNQRCSDIDIKTATCKFINDQTQQTIIEKSKVIIGCDGAFSAARLALQLKTDLFNYSQEYLQHAYKQLVIPADQNRNFKMKKNALHIWPRKSFMMIALPNLDGSFTCTLFLQLKGEQSFQTLKDQNSLMKFFGKYFSDAIPLMPTLKQDFFRNPAASLVTIKCFPWSQSDKMCLMGDSVHAIVPFFGQGMNCGFQDCLVFNQLIDKHGQNWKQIFKQFQTIRKPNTDAVAQLALDNFIEMRDKTSDPKFLLRKKIQAKIAAQNPNYITMYAQVTFSPHISYEQAYKDGQRQNEYLNKLVEIEYIFQKWQKEEVQTIIQKLVNK